MFNSFRLVIAALGLASALVAQAQEPYPKRSIRWIVPYLAGTSDGDQHADVQAAGVRRDEGLRSHRTDRHLRTRGGHELRQRDRHDARAHRARAQGGGRTAPTTPDEYAAALRAEIGMAEKMMAAARLDAQ